MNWWQRLFGSERLEAELDKELRFHFEQQVAENIRSGMTEEQARRATRLAFGGLSQVKEDCRESRGTHVGHLRRSGPSLYFAHLTPRSRIHLGGGLNPCSRHRRQHRGLQRGRYHFAAAVAFS